MLIKSLFWQIINSIIKICLEIFVFDRKIRRILKGNWAKFYLRKYVVKGTSFSPHPSPPPIKGGNEACDVQKDEPQIIWQYWESKDGSVPPLVQACLNSVDKFKGNRKRIILTYDKLKDYIDLPQNGQFVLPLNLV